MSESRDEGRERRKHARGPAPVSATLRIGAPVPIARVVDVSAGGVLLELPMGIEPPALGAAGYAQLVRGASYLERHARVVRVRWRGRDKGAALPPAVALMFDDADLEAARRWERMIWTPPPA